MISGVLMRVADRLSRPFAWVQGMAATDGRTFLPACDPDAIAWDLFGAVMVECRGDLEQMEAAFRALKPGDWPPGVSIIDYNDDPSRTQDEVVAHVLRCFDNTREEEDLCRP